MSESIEDFRISILEQRVDQTATKADLDNLEDKILTEIRSFKQLLKYGALALVVVLSGSGIISSDVLANLLLGM